MQGQRPASSGKRSDRRSVADRAVRSDLVIVSTPFLHLFPGVVKAQEPVGIQAYGPELAVKGFDKGVIRHDVWG